MKKFQKKKRLTTFDSLAFQQTLLEFTYVIYNVPVPLILFLNTKTNKMKYSITQFSFIYDILDV